MSREIQERLDTLAEPTVIKVDEFDTLLADNILLAKEVLGNDWLPLESDPYMKKLRVLTLRQMHNQADKNETIRQMLVTTATGINLDHLGLEKEVVRDNGEKPRALMTFELSTTLPFDVTIPGGTILNNSTDASSQEPLEAVIVENLLIKKGDVTVQGAIELNKYVVSSEVKCENIVTTLPFVVAPKQLSSFENGFVLEDDERYRMRIILSNAKYSTAGCSDAYEYYTRFADSRIDDVKISATDGVVYIVVHSFSSTDEAMLERISTVLTDKTVRPISDKPTPLLAVVENITLDIEIELFDLLEAVETEKVIRANFKDSLFIGQDLVLSDVLRKCHLDNVYRVNTDFSDLIIDDTKVIVIDVLNISFREVAE